MCIGIVWVRLRKAVGLLDIYLFSVQCEGLVVNIEDTEISYHSAKELPQKKIVGDMRG